MYKHRVLMAFIFFSVAFFINPAMSRADVAKITSTPGRLAQLPPAEKGTNGSATLTPTVVDLGSILPGSAKRTSITLQNSGINPLIYQLGPVSGWRPAEAQINIPVRGNSTENLNLTLSAVRDRFLDNLPREKGNYQLKLTIEGAGQVISYRQELPEGSYKESIPTLIQAVQTEIQLMFKLGEAGSEPNLVVYPRWIDFASASAGERINGQVRIRNRGQELLRWTASFSASAPKSAEEKVEGGRFLSLQNQEVRSTGIYLPPRHLRDQLELTGRWSEEGGYPLGQPPQSTMRFRFTGTGIALMNLRRSPGGNMAVLVDDHPLFAPADQQTEIRDADLYKIENLVDGQHTMTILSRDGTVLLEGMKIFGRELMKIPAGSVRIFPASGVTTRETDYLTVRVDTQKLSPGSYLGYIEVLSNGGTETVELYLEVSDLGVMKLLDVNRYVKDREYLFTTNLPLDNRKLLIGGHQRQGVVFRLFPPGTPGTAEFFRWHNPQKGDYFYSYQQQVEGKSLSGYIFEGTIGNIATSRMSGARPLNRWFNRTTGRHFFTIDPKGEDMQKQGYAYEGIAGFVR